MERQFNLIKSDFEKHEKLVLPRFPFCYLTFKADETSRVYEVKDISHTGMQLALKQENKFFELDSLIHGSIHWLGNNLEITGVVKWQTPQRVGIEFQKKKDALEKVKKFLRNEEIIKKLKPLHKVSDGLEIPNRLKYWLRSDGPVEIFVWQHADGEIAKCQALYFETFVEWEDGVGLKTGRIISKRNVDSPLINEDEWLFKIDQSLDLEKVNRVKDLVKLLPSEIIPADLTTFIVRQLS